MATICTILATTPLSSSTSYTRSSSSSPSPLNKAGVTSAVVLSVPPARWSNRSSKRSKAPVLASPWSDHSQHSFSDWMAQQDGAGPSAAFRTTQPAASHMHRRSSLPSFPLSASSIPASPISSSSMAFSPLHSLAAVPTKSSSRLHSAPSATRDQTRSSLQHAKPNSKKAASNSPNVDAAAGGANRFENLHLRLAAHPAIQRLQQLEEAHEERQVSADEEEEEDVEDDVAEPEREELTEQNVFQHEADDKAPVSQSRVLPAPADVPAPHSVLGVSDIDEGEHAPLAGLVTAFPFVQQFIPQPSRAEKKKQFIQRIHSSHQLTITNNYPDTVTSTTRLSLPPQPNFSAAAHIIRQDCLSPHLPLALQNSLRSISSTPTVSSDDSHEDVSSEHDSWSSGADCSSSALADTFASLSPGFVHARPSTGFPFTASAPLAVPFFGSPVLSTSVLHMMPPVFASPASNSCGSSLCPDDLQLGERAWDDGGHWMGDW